MANNVEITAGSGTPVATDDVSGNHFQKIKLADGTEDSATMILAGGGVEAAALRVTIANDSTGVLSVDDNGGALTVDGTVAATQSGTWNIGTVTTVTAVTSITNVVHVDDNSGSLTVDNAGTFAVQAVCTNAGTFAVQAAQSGTWTVTGTGGTFPVTDSGGSLTVDNNGTFAVQAVCTNAGTFAVQAASAGDVAHDATDSGNPVKVGAVAETSPKGITLVSDADRTNLYADADGLLMVKLGTSGADHISERVTNTDGASTAFTNFDAVAGQKNAVTGYSIFRTDSGSTLIYVDFRDGTGGSVLWSVPIPAGGGANFSLAGQPLFKTSANTALAYDVSAATTTVVISVTGFKTKV